MLHSKMFFLMVCYAYLHDIPFPDARDKRMNVFQFCRLTKVVLMVDPTGNESNVQFVTSIKSIQATRGHSHICHGLTHRETIRDQDRVC